MFDFDEKIKEYARMEKVQIPEGFELRMSGLLRTLADPNPEGNSSVRKIKPAMIAAITGVLVLMIGGVAYASGAISTIISSITYNWNGEIIGTIYEDQEPVTFTFAADYVPESADEYAFRQEKAEGEIRRYGSVDENGYFHEEFGSAVSAREEVGSMAELERILRDADIPILKLPSYIPEGYEVTRIYVSYYMSPEIFTPYMEPSETRISENGKEMQIFTLPDGHKRYVGSYQILLTDGNGNTMDIGGLFNETFELTGFGASPDAEVSIPDIEGFDRAIYYKSSYIDGGAVNTDTNIFVEHKMDDVEFYVSGDMDFARSGRDSEPAAGVYDNIRYWISAYNNELIDEAEMTSIIDNLTIPR